MLEEGMGGWDDGVREVEVVVVRWWVADGWLKGRRVGTVQTVCVY